MIKVTNYLIKDYKLSKDKKFVHVESRKISGDFRVEKIVYRKNAGCTIHGDLYYFNDYKRGERFFLMGAN